MLNCEAAATPMNNNDKLQGVDGNEKENPVQNSSLWLKLSNTH